jgi:hypothetical protein
MKRVAAARCEILRREELLERLQKRKQTLARTGTLGPVRKTLALAEPLSDEQLELLELEPGVSASEVEAKSRIFIPYIRFSDGT